MTTDPIETAIEDVDAAIEHVEEADDSTLTLFVALLLLVLAKALLKGGT